MRVGSCRVQLGRFPLVVLGVSQRGLDVRPVVPAMVRRSGGGAVLSGTWLLRTTLVMPRSSAFAQAGPSGASLWFGGIHRSWLTSLGVQGATIYRGASVEHWACFGGLVSGEVVVSGRKIVGIAQVWGGRTITLSAGTLVAPVPWRLLCQALQYPDTEGAELAAGTTSIEECLRRPANVNALASGLRQWLERCSAV